MSQRDSREYSGIVDRSGSVEDPQMWADHYLHICRVNRWKDDADKLLNVGLYFMNEVATWYEVEKEWIEAKGRTWDEFQTKFIRRFRPANYAQHLQGFLLRPKQLDGESARAYGDRYRKLWIQVGQTKLLLDDLKDIWISGLCPTLKQEVRMFDPTTFDYF